jgi:hypothetical protein
MSSFLKKILEHFGFTDEQPVWPWGNAGRRVELHEQPPPRLPILPEHQRRQLPPGLSDPIGWREVTFGQQRIPKDIMSDYLHDGGIFSRKKDK